MQKSHNQINQQRNLPPRTFPKKQYRRETGKLWLLIIGIVVIIVAVFLIGSGMGNHKASHKTPAKRVARPVHHHVTHHHNMKIKKPKATKPNLKQGEKLLGHWLIKLHYAPAQSQRILTIYERSNYFEEKSINQHLTMINNENQSKAAKQTAIKQYLHQKFASTK